MLRFHRSGQTSSRHWPPSTRHETDRSRWLVRFCILLIRSYQLLIKPRFPPSCRFVPSCSEFAILKIRSLGIQRGVAATVRRLVLCQPLGDFSLAPKR